MSINLPSPYEVTATIDRETYTITVSIASSGGGNDITLTTTGTEGAATLVNNVLNIPRYDLKDINGGTP